MGNIENAIGSLGTLFGDIARAIRTKDGSVGSITPANFPVRILNIPTEGTDNNCQVKVTEIIKTAFSWTLEEIPQNLFWSEYSCLTGEFIDSIETLPAVLAFDSLYLKYIGDELLIAYDDNICLLNVNETGSKVDFDDYRIWIYKLPSLSTLSISGYLMTEGETYKWTIPDNDATNSYLSQITAPDMQVQHNLEADANLNYALDHILGISDPENSTRTFLEPLTIIEIEGGYIKWENLIVSEEVPQIKYQVFYAKNNSADYELFEEVYYNYDPQDEEHEEGEEPAPVYCTTTHSVEEIEEWSTLKIKVTASAERYYNKTSNTLVLTKGE